MMLNRCEFRENRRRAGHSFRMVISEIKFSVYSGAVRHFESKESLDKACVLFAPGGKAAKA